MEADCSIKPDKNYSKNKHQDRLEHDGMRERRTDKVCLYDCNLFLTKLAVKLFVDFCCNVSGFFSVNSGTNLIACICTISQLLDRNTINRRKGITNIISSNCRSSGRINIKGICCKLVCSSRVQKELCCRERAIQNLCINTFNLV